MVVAALAALSGTELPQLEDQDLTTAQVNAAKLKIKRSAATGRFLPASVTAIANATATGKAHTAQAS